MKLNDIKRQEAEQAEAKDRREGLVAAIFCAACTAVIFVAIWPKS